MKIAKVIVDVPSSSVNQTFDYLVPKRFEEIIEVGIRVLVPFGPRKITGFVVAIVNDSEFTKLRELIDVLDITPALTHELLEVGKWMAEETLCLYITAFQAMLPQALKSTYDKEYIRLTDEGLPGELENLFQDFDCLTNEYIEKSGIALNIIQKAVKEGLIEVRYTVKSNITKKRITMVAPNGSQFFLQEKEAEISGRAEKQKEIIAFFIEQPEPISQKLLLEAIHTTASTVKTLVKKGILKTYQEEVMRNPYDDAKFNKTVPLVLTEEQENAIRPIKNCIDHHEAEVFLLHGVTGSGKTEIYLQAIDEVIQKGREAIVLVPEIALTPQMVTRFKERFGSNVAVMHSALSHGEKYDEWRKIQRKEVQVVVGARSAIFAPFENIGIIIMDEEHETTYKQEDQPRYHARDVAIKRSEIHQCPVILGSATPTLESYARAQKGVYTLLTMTERTNKQAMPQVRIVDMREELRVGNRTMFSRELKEAIDLRLKKNEQIVLLLNRRGYSTFVMCRDCGHVKECPHCDIALTYHKNSHRLKCHYCSYEEQMPLVCPECESDAIRYFGTGTQRVEEALTSLIPEARIIRMDVDTTRRKGAHEKLLNQFGNGEADILLGTQMIAKGLDFKNVTLVGVLTADSMLHLPDFRSSERTFQLLTQVSGRAGRHELPGEVIVQTYTPDHYTVELASEHNYLEFYKKEMAVRRMFQYPPYVYLALVTVSHPNQVRTVQITQQIVQLLRKQIQPQSTILGPTPSPITRMKDRYRYQCMIKYKNEPYLSKIMQNIMNLFIDDINKDELQIKIDLQPYHLM